MVINFNNIIILLVVLLYLAGCETNPKAPEDASTTDILFGNGVEKYLAYKRIQLQKLQNRVNILDEDIVTKLGQLYSIEKKLNKVQNKIETSNYDIATLLKEVQKQKTLAETTLSKLSSMQEKVTSLEAKINKNRQFQERDRKQIEELNKEILVLEEHNRIIDRAIVRSLNLKAEQLFKG